MNGIATAAISIFTAAMTAYLGNFVATDYRRFCDGQSLAAALLGELKSHQAAIPELKVLLQTLEVNSDNSIRSTLRPIGNITDPIFDAGVKELGLLGSYVVEDVVFVYQQIKAFRVSFKILSEHYKEMTDAEFGARCSACLKKINLAEERGIPLSHKLEKLINQKYRNSYFGWLFKIINE